jgi:hypothetical protein
VLNDKIIHRDKQSCDNILTGYLEDKINEDHRKQMLSKERQSLRYKLRERHNLTYELEEKCGVRLGSVTNLRPKEPSTENDDFLMESFMPAPQDAHRQTVDFARTLDVSSEQRKSTGEACS